MTWSRQEPIFPWHPKVMGLSDAAFRLCVTARDYATLMQTDGFIAERLVPGLFRVSRMTKKLKAAIAELTAVQPGEVHPLWEPAEGGYRVHDYRDYAGSEADVAVESRPPEVTAAKAAGGRARAAGAVRVNGRFVRAAGAAAGAPAGGSAGAAGDQQAPAPASIAAFSSSSAGPAETSNEEKAARVLVPATDDLLVRASCQHPGVDPWLSVPAVVWEDVKGGQLLPIGRFQPLQTLRDKGEPLLRVAFGLRRYLQSSTITLPGVRDYISKFNDYAPRKRRGPTATRLHDPPKPPADEVERMKAISQGLPWMRRAEA